MSTQHLWLVVVGDPASGLFFHGPFASMLEAETWASSEIKAAWWVAPIEDARS